MSFQLFAEQHGLIINDLEHGRWVRVPTIDHPNKKNGCYIFEGTKGAVQNWAVHEKPVTWFSGAKEWVPDADYKAKREQAKKEKEARQRAAAKKAAWILNNSTQSTHPYLVKKGFPEAKWHVWNDLLVIPMRLGNTLVGCQMIDKTGSKKFLSGQLTKGVHCGFDNKGIDILAEGFATAMSIRRALKAARTRYKVWVCFSASNLIEVSKRLKSGVVVADHDSAGITAAKKTGFITWLSDAEGEDFNDYELRVGAQVAGESLSSRILMVNPE